MFEELEGLSYEDSVMVANVVINAVRLKDINFVDSKLNILSPSDKVIAKKLVSYIINQNISEGFIDEIFNIVNKKLIAEGHKQKISVGRLVRLSKGEFKASYRHQESRNKK